MGAVDGRRHLTAVINDEYKNKNKRKLLLSARWGLEILEAFFMVKFVIDVRRFWNICRKFSEKNLMKIRNE